MTVLEWIGYAILALPILGIVVLTIAVFCAPGEW